MLAPRRGPERILDFLLRTGPYGEGFGADPEGSSLDALLDHPHGIDYGALKPRLPDVLRTPDGMIALAPELLLGRRRRACTTGSTAAATTRFVLVGRRDLRSNNSLDAQRLGAREGQAPVHAAPPPRRRGRASGWPTATTAVVAVPGGGGARARWRSPTPSGPAS